jgi:hypothetical protein
MGTAYSTHTPKVINVFIMLVEKSEENKPACICADKTKIGHKNTV